MFRCPNSGICLPEDFRCDGEYDCDPLGDWDEKNCEARQVDLATTQVPMNVTTPILVSSVRSNKRATVQNK